MVGPHDHPNRRLNAMSSSESGNVQVDLEVDEGTRVVMTKETKRNFQADLEGDEVTRSFMAKEIEWNQRRDDMSPKLWGLFNEDLQDRVLAWLPFHSIARARTVCKRWSTLLKSSSFLETYSRVPSRTTPTILMFDSNNWSTCWLYNPFVNHWHLFPVQFEPGESKFPCAAAGGLVCFCGVGLLATLYVCNPLTKQWRELRPMIKDRLPYVVGMVVDESSKSYRVVVAGDYNEQYARSTEVYDSRFNCWTLMQGDIPGESLIPRSACCMGYMFCFTGDPFGLVAFDIQRGTWSEIKAPMPAFLTSPHLVGCPERLLMVGGLTKHIIPESIRIWQLDLQALEWEEVVAMPDILCRNFYNESFFGGFMCVGQDNFICFTRAKSNFPQALMYDVNKKTWQWLPSSPYSSTVESYRLHVGMAFCPRWDMSVEDSSGSSVAKLRNPAPGV